MSKRRLIGAVCGLLLAAAAARGEVPLNDPMRPFQAVDGSGGPGAAPAPRFRLTAVLISPQRRVAVVNGKPYQQGAHVDGAEITRIDAQSIQLRDGDEQLVVHLGGKRVSAPAVEGEHAQ